jgi:hypothetical protein
MGLAVDHRHPTGTDREMVDIRLPVARDPAIVQQPDFGSVEMLGQPSRTPDLSVPALPPDLR